MSKPTSVARSLGITAVWYDGRVIAAWDERTGECSSPFEAHSLTKDDEYLTPFKVPPFVEAGPPPAPGPMQKKSFLLGPFGSGHFNASCAMCVHGVEPARLCTVCNLTSFLGGGL